MTTRRSRIDFIRLFIGDEWFVTEGIVGDLYVVVPRDIIALYPHRRTKK